MSASDHSRGVRPADGLPRRGFLRAAGALGAGVLGLPAAHAAPPEGKADGGGDIPLRPFGKTDVKVSCLGFGGHHLGDARGVDEAIRLVQEAVDAGVTFFDNCWEYVRRDTAQLIPV